MLAPSVSAEAPPGWVEAAAEIPQPPLGSGSGAAFVQWQAWREPRTRETLLLACVATPIPGWVDDMRPSVEARTVSVMNASTERVVGYPVETREMPGHFAIRAVGAPVEQAAVGSGRTFVGWSEHDVMTCFAACASRQRDNHTDVRRICDASVAGARLDGSRPPPPPGIALGATTWAVHHPATAVRWGAAVIFVLGVLAVASRRRQRSRI